jgi:uncharacterized RDD family membrane protein YckC
MNWHYAENGRQIGPVTDGQLLELFQSGKITADTLVWHEGMPDWTTYHQATAGHPLSPEPPPMPANAPAPGPGEVVCAECGRMFPADETVRMGKASVCAACKPIFLQKLSEGAKINTGELNYAGFGIRFGAKILDGLILGIPFAIVYFASIFPLIAMSKGKEPTATMGLLPLLIQFGFIFVQMAYTIFFLGKYGATPGKMICKIKVVTSEGDRISYGRATGRFFAELLSGMICYIGYIMVAFDDQKRGLHDHICNTRVIYK